MLPKSYYLVKEATERQGLEKQAVIGSFLASAAAAHLLPNMGMKVMKGTQGGRRALAGLFSAGVDHGMQGVKLHPNWEHFAQYGIGPESMVEYQAGNKLGNQLAQRGINPESRDAFLNAVRTGDINLEHKGVSVNAALNAHLNTQGLTEGIANSVEGVPLLNSVSHFINGTENKRVRQMVGKFPTRPIGQGVQPIHRVIDAGLAATTAAVTPHMATGIVVNGVRKAVGHSGVGKQLMAKSFLNGVSGKITPRPLRGLTDLAVSPSVLDPERIGNYVGQNIPETIRPNINAKNAKRVVDARNDLVSAKDNIMGVINDFRQKR